jgi:hypothetical protein
MKHISLLAAILTYFPTQKGKNVGLGDQHAASVCLHAWVRARVPSIFYLETTIFKTLVQALHYHRNYIILVTGGVVKEAT